MSYSQIANVERIEREIQWLEFQREYEKEKVQKDFTTLMRKLEDDKSNQFESVMKTLKMGKTVKKSWADMVEEDEDHGWVSGWPKSKNHMKKVTWADRI